MITHAPEHYKPRFEAPSSALNFGPEYFGGASDYNDDDAREDEEEETSLAPGPPYLNTDDLRGAMKPPLRNPFSDSKPGPYSEPPRKEVYSGNSGRDSSRYNGYEDEEYYGYERRQPAAPRYDTQPKAPKRESPVFPVEKEDGGEEGFFSMPSGFPNLSDLGANFESMKIRNKRSADPQESRDYEREREMMIQERRFVPHRRRMRQPQERSYNRHPYRRNENYGGGGGFNNGDFWEDVDTKDFFANHGGYGQRNQPYRRNANIEQGYQGYREPPQQQQHNNHQYHERPFQQPAPQKYTPSSYHQQSLNGFSIYNSHNKHPHSPAHGYSTSSKHREPYPQSSVQSFPNKGFERKSKLNTQQALQEERDNEILGSGNFEIIRGGTFFDEDTYYYSQRRPNNNYYEKNSGDIFENFRDFADIKGDVYRNQYY